MNCFPCFGSSQKVDEDIHLDQMAATISPQQQAISWTPPTAPKVESYHKDEANTVDTSKIDAKQFTFRELATATKNFRQETLIGECGYGRIYKGILQPSGQVVTVKRFDKNRSSGGNKEFLKEVLDLSFLRHSNLLKLVGYCADGDQRLLVYEYMPMGSLKEHLLELDEKKKPLDWATRIKIASGIAKGIEYLHDQTKPSVIYRDLKCTNVMLDEDFSPKLSDHGLARLGGGHHSRASQVIVMGRFGYGAPEYEQRGELTVKSDVYTYGIVLLELIAGRGAMDTTKNADEQNLVEWAQPIFKDPRRYSELADPRLNNSYPVRSLNQIVGIAAMCIQDEPDVRPLIADVVAALSSFSDVLQEDPTPETISPEKAPSRRSSSDYSGNSSDCPSSDDSDEESDSEIHYKDKHDHIDAKIEYGKKKNNQNQKDISKDEEMYNEIQYKQTHDHKNQYDQKDTHMNKKNGYLKEQYDQKNVSSDDESDYKVEKCSKKQYELNYSMDEESESEDDSESIPEDIILSPGQSSSDRSARSDSER